MPLTHIVPEPTAILVEDEDAGFYDTAYSIAPGMRFEGLIESSNDSDYIGLQVEAGKSYLLEGLAQSSNRSTQIHILHPDLGHIAWAADTVDPQRDIMRFVAPSTETYFVGVDMEGAFGTGHYAITLTEINYPTFGNALIADYLTFGYWLDQGETQQAWDLGADRTLSYNTSALTPEGQQLAFRALDAWSLYSGITFSQTPGLADITFDDTEPGGWAETVTVGNTIVSATINVEAALSEDNPTIASEGYFTYLHEIGHVLGLGHGGSYNGVGEYHVDSHYANDTWQFTVMSYFNGADRPFSDTFDAFPVTPMQADIAALELLYGPTIVNLGDTVYGQESTFGSTFGNYLRFGPTGGMPSDVPPFQWRNGIATILDGGGTDTIDATGWDYQIQIDLREGAFSRLINVKNGLSIAPGSVIENAIGARFSDTIVGNDSNNHLIGADSNDTLTGAAGDDTLDGGPGTDTAVFTTPSDAITLHLIDPDTILFEDRRSTGDGTDHLIGIEHLELPDGVPLLGDGPFPLHQFLNATSLIDDGLIALSELYIAYFGRAPDAIGLLFWADVMANGMSLDAISTHFFDQDETRAAYEDLTDTSAFIQQVYVNVLGRQIDSEGFAFWHNVLSTDAVSRPAFILEILRGAKAPAPHDASQAFIDQQLADAAYLADKTALGMDFALVRGMSNVDHARATMAAFDGTPESLHSATQMIAEFETAALSAETGEFLMRLVGVANVLDEIM